MLGREFVRVGVWLHSWQFLVLSIEEFYGVAWFDLWYLGHEGTDYYFKPIPDDAYHRNKVSHSISLWYPTIVTMLYPSIGDIWAHLPSGPKPPQPGFPGWTKRERERDADMVLSIVMGVLQNGWFLLGKIPSRNGWWLGLPLWLRKSPYWKTHIICLHLGDDYLLTSRFSGATPNVPPHRLGFHEVLNQLLRCLIT